MGRNELPKMESLTIGIIIVNLVECKLRDADFENMVSKHIQKLTKLWLSNYDVTKGKTI